MNLPRTSQVLSRLILYIFAILPPNPVSQGGVRGRLEATGHGVFFGLLEARSHEADMKKIGLTKGLAGGTVHSEIRPGYFWNDKLLRAALVVVAQ